MLCDGLHAWLLIQSRLMARRRAGLRLNEGTGLKTMSKLVGVWYSVFGRAHRGSTVGFLLLQRFHVSSHVVDLNARNKSLTAKLLQQGYRYHKLRKTFSKFYRRHYELVSKFNVGLKHFCIKAYRNRNFMVT